MNKINDGGPAFARPMSQWHSPDGQPCEPDFGSAGLSTRDYFAGQALIGMGTWMPDFSPSGEPTNSSKSLCNPHMLKERAGWAYAQADAMLTARNKTQEKSK